MAEEEIEVTPTDIFGQYKQITNMLVDILAEKAIGQPQQVVYAAAAEPAAKAPNYLVYLAVGVLAILLFKK